ncbi:MAG: RidA family protein [Dehalococcoidia bacterium]|jgi:enamine deaminase RidA (YjgF/YER057c/UK114 family)
MHRLMQGIMAHIIESKEIPIGLGPYSNAISINDFIFISGTLGFNRKKTTAGMQDGKPTLTPQIDQIFNTFKGIYKSLGTDAINLLKMNAYLSSWDQYNNLSSSLQSHLSKMPAISVNGHGLINNGFLAEIDCIGTTSNNIKVIKIPGFTHFANAPAAIQMGDYIFLSGFAGVDKNGKVVKKGDIQAQTKQALEWVKIALEQAGATPKDVVKNHTTIVDWRDFDQYNAIYAEFYGEPYPTRASIQGTLSDPDKLIEFDVIAIINQKKQYVDTAIRGQYQTNINRKNVHLDNRLTPGVAPHCAGIRTDDFISISGMVATDLDGELIGPGDIKAQTKAIMDGITYALETLGSTSDDIVKSIVSLVDWRHYEEFNKIYESYFTPPYPTRTAFQGGLAQYGLMIEIEVFAIPNAKKIGTYIIGA